MMLGRALSADFLKMRRKGIWFLAFLGPVGLLAMQALDFGLRYDYMMELNASDLWGALIQQLSFFVPLALFMGSTLIASLIANVEHQSGSWKQLLALPISRSAVFTSKYLLGVIVLLISCLLLSGGTIILGLALKFKAEIPIQQLLSFTFLPLLAALPLLAFQLWLSLIIKNQALPVTIGITASIASLFSGNFPAFVPLTWPTYSIMDSATKQLLLVLY
ncbi:ABC transporter permease [Paenibacillus pini]|uniref:Permease n=1 Tax=Paenibacillus pini JCM 16418 TaxID=1236976 RepID=W7YYZ5_9BACL|nr:ABC transporter permease [Paenibacillus pini]GAF09871.1 permease [Paenibacillus pini JCM 16418]